MHLEQVSNIEALYGLVGLIAFAVLIFRVIPRAPDIQRFDRFEEADITRHDSALPKYFLVTTVALAIGALHLAIRSVPVVAAWLAQGGHGGHLVRDIAYSHMVVVLGGTIAVTGLTWYALPRICRRPLYSDTLAQLAFWGTVVGATGFYLSNVTAGTAIAAMEHSGSAEWQVDYSVGIWRSLAGGISASVMGLGYWIYVTNVLLTVFAGRTDERRPLRHLTKFFVFGALGLFVGTVQGVIQVVPEAEDWLHASGLAGRYIDPISHAHVNLVTGVMSLVAGLVFYASGEGRAQAGKKLIEEIVFWTLIPGSLALYVVLLYLGFEEGDLVVQQGLSFPEAVREMGAWHTLPLLTSGAVTLVGLFVFIFTAVKRFSSSWRVGAGRITIVIGALALSIGIIQGGIQMLPPVKDWLVASGSAGEAIANAHAQLNILGGVLVLLLGLMLALGKPMVGAQPSAALARRVSMLLGAGALLYYASALVTAVASGAGIQQGASAKSAFFPPMGGPVMILGALLYFSGALTLAVFAWQSTRDYRANGWQRLLFELKQQNRSAAPWRRRVRTPQILLPEGMAAIFGFPGLGWILSGRALIGVPLMFGGPVLAWAVLPLLMSPYGDERLPHLSFLTLEVYLLTTAVVSVAVLWAMIGFGRRTTTFRGQPAAAG